MAPSPSLEDKTMRLSEVDLRRGAWHSGGSCMAQL